MTPDEQLLCDRPSNGVLRLRLNRPERRNALATPLLLEVADALDTAAVDPDIRVVVIVGAPKVFAAGADLQELADGTDTDPVETPRFLGWARIRDFPKPLLAGVEGWCLGAGNELAMCCDIVVAGEDARFGQPESNLGIIPGAGGTVTLTQLVGRARAMLMVLTGVPLSAREALAAGLIAEVTATGEAEDAALSLAAAIATRAPRAMREGKASVREAARMAEAELIRAERARFVALLGTADKAEGLAAFWEKRVPEWHDR